MATDSKIMKVLNYIATKSIIALVLVFVGLCYVIWPMTVAADKIGKLWKS